MGRLCCTCKEAAPNLKRPKTNELICKTCFFKVFEDEVHETITKCQLFKKGEKIVIGASGGKDSTALAHILSILNTRHNYDLELFLLAIDEGISGYRDDSLETVKRNQIQYNLPLKILSYKDLYGWTMDEIVEKIGKKNNCTFCGVFRRQALDRGAFILGADKIATGHNADDMAETIFLNLIRGDIARLARCTDNITGDGSDMPRVKPFKYTYQKEIVMYAYYKKLDYFTTECVYAPNATRGTIRDLIKDLEAVEPKVISNIIKSGEEYPIPLHYRSGGTGKEPGNCERCGYITSQKICKACLLLEGLNTGNLDLGVRRPRKNKKETSSCLNNN